MLSVTDYTKIYYSVDLCTLDTCSWNRVYGLAGTGSHLVCLLSYVSPLLIGRLVFVYMHVFTLFCLLMSIFQFSTSFWFCIQFHFGFSFSHVYE